MAEVLYPKAAPCPQCGAAAALVAVVRDVAHSTGEAGLAHVGAARYECQTRTCGTDRFWRAAAGESLVPGAAVSTWPIPPGRG